ncbi:hypothetical protein BC830DRAFT_792679 [Chytriomyces sp. MP71]|nr:hypothetical protein BC830DRAFT_792679 [Chytriomyces sp. MP71]
MEEVQASTLSKQTRAANASNETDAGSDCGSRAGSIQSVRSAQSGQSLSSVAARSPLPSMPPILPASAQEPFFRSLPLVVQRQLASSVAANASSSAPVSRRTSEKLSAAAPAMSTNNEDEEKRRLRDEHKRTVAKLKSLAFVEASLSPTQPLQPTTAASHSKRIRSLSDSHLLLSVSSHASAIGHLTARSPKRAVPAATPSSPLSPASLRRKHASATSLRRFNSQASLIATARSLLEHLEALWAEVTQPLPPSSSFSNQGSPKTGGGKWLEAKEGTSDAAREAAMLCSKNRDRTVSEEVAELNARFFFSKFEGRTPSSPNSPQIDKKVIDALRDDKVINNQALMVRPLDPKPNFKPTQHRPKNKPSPLSPASNP